MSEKPGAIVVSACLLGVHCRYDGGASSRSCLAGVSSDRLVIPVCPEVLAGMGVPRDPMSFETLDEGRLLGEEKGLKDSKGVDQTARLLQGVRRAVDLAVAGGATEAILKERSPSCGVREVYLGKKRTPGRGLFTALLEQEGIRCRSDEEVE